MTEGSTTTPLRNDADTGRAGSKVAATDPAVPSFGVDDEAAGTTLSGDHVDTVCRAEVKPDWRQGARWKGRIVMDREKTQEDRSRRQPDEPTKPAGEEVAPPGERVDDEVGSDEQKKTRRQE